MKEVKVHNRKDREAIRKKLRSNMTPAEAALWRSLQRSRLGMKFRRQHSVGPFVLDFYCPEFKLAIELEGQIHRDPVRQEYDAERHAYLVSQGIRILYFENRIVFENGDAVRESIQAAAKGIF